MIEFINYKQFLNHNRANSWKLPFKIGLFCIFLGYIIFVLKELIVSFICLIFFITGIYCLYFQDLHRWIYYNKFNDLPEVYQCKVDPILCKTHSI